MIRNLILLSTLFVVPVLSSTTPVTPTDAGCVNENSAFTSCLIDLDEEWIRLYVVRILFSFVCRRVYPPCVILFFLSSSCMFCMNMLCCVSFGFFHFFPKFRIIIPLTIFYHYHCTTNRKLIIYHQQPPQTLSSINNNQQQQPAINQQ